MTWTKKSAIKELNSLIDQAKKLRASYKGSPEFVRWYMRATTVLEEIFGQQSKYYATFHILKFETTGSFFVQGWDLDAEIARKNQQGFVSHLGSAIGLFQSAIDALERRSLDEVYDGKDTPPESSALLKLLNLAERKLRKVIRQPPKREKEIQDAFENLLIGAEIEYKRELPAIEYSSKTYIPETSVLSAKRESPLDVSGRRISRIQSRCSLHSARHTKVRQTAARR
jgi:hypothetical protein